MADDIASLGFAVDSSQALTGAAALDKLSASGKTAEAQAQKVATAHTLAATQTARLVAEMTAAQRVIYAFGEAASGVSGQLVALSAGAGPVGVFLSALGPWGLAASVGLMLAEVAMHALVESAKKVGDSSIELVKFSAATGLSIDQLTAFKKAGAQLGIESSDVEQRLARFTQQLHALNDATGPLYLEILKVNPAIADQMVKTHDAAEQINLYAKAWTDASFAQRSMMDKIAFGRGGNIFGQVMGSITDQGGLDATVAKIGQFKVFTQQETEEMARMGIQIKENDKIAEKFTASITAMATLKAMVAWSEQGKQFAISMKEAADEADRLSRAPFWERVGRGFDVEAAAMPFAPRSLSSPSSSTGNLAAAAASSAGGDPLLQAAQQITALTKAQNDNKASATALANQYKAWAAVMGDAMTPTEQFTAKTLELNKAIEEHAGKLTAADIARRRAVSSQDELVKGLQLNNSVLGSGATFTEQYNEKLEALRLTTLKAGADLGPNIQKRGEEAIVFDKSKAILAAYIGVLGAAASVEEQVRVAMER